MAGVPDDLAGAIECAITADALRAAFLGASRQRGACGHATAQEPRCSPTDLERAAAALRERVMAEALARCLGSLTLGDSHTSVFVGDTTKGLDVTRTDTSASGHAEEATTSVSVALRDAVEPPFPTRLARVDVELGQWKDCSLACPQCRRPLDFRIRPGTDGHPPQGQDAGRYAYCAVLLGGGVVPFLQAFILGYSLVSAGCVEDRILFHSHNLPAPYLEVLRQVWTLRPIRSWPRLWNRAASLDEEVVKLRALELVEYSKVLVLDLGIIVLSSSVAEAFRLECPAAPLRGAALDMSAMLLRPCSAAYRAMVSEIGSERATGAPWEAACALEAGLGGYLRGFYDAFFTGAWTEFPAELAPSVAADESASAMWRASAEAEIWLDALSVLQQGSIATDARLVRGLLAAVGESRLRGGSDSLVDVVGLVDHSRCARCHTYDDGGRATDGGGWLCRLCWGTAASNSPSGVPSQVEAAELRKALGPWLIAADRQRWACVGHA